MSISGMLIRLKRNPKFSRLLKQFITILSGRFAAASIQAVTILLLARWSEPSEFGIAVSIIGVFTVAQTLGDMGVTVYSIREAAQRGVSGKVKAAERLSFIATAAVSTVLAVCLLAAATAVEGVGHGFLLLCVWLVLERALNVKGSIALGLGRAEVGVRNVLARRALHLISFLLLYAMGLDSVISYLIAAAGTSVVVYIVTVNRFYTRSEVPTESIGLVFVECRPYWIHSLSLQIRNVDAMVVTALGGAVQGAYYGLASRMANPLRMVPAAVSSALLPFMSSTGVERSKERKYLTLLAVGMSLPYIALVMVVPYGVELVIGSEYLEAVLPIQIVVGTLAISSCSSVFTVALQSKGAAASVSRISLISSLLYMVFLVVGVIIGGATGAAIGFSFGLIIQMSLLVLKYYAVTSGDL